MGFLTDITTGTAAKSGGSGSGDSDSGGLVGKVRKYLDKKSEKKRQSSYSESGASDGSPETPSLHSGGPVRKTGEYRLRKGERVMTKGQMKKMRGRKSR